MKDVASIMLLVPTLPAQLEREGVSRIKVALVHSPPSSSSVGTWHVSAVVKTKKRAASTGTMLTRFPCCGGGLWVERGNV